MTYGKKDPLISEIEYALKDDYGFFYKMEDKVAVALNSEGYALYRNHLEEALAKAYEPYHDKPVKFIYDYPVPVYQTADILKDIYFARKDLKSFQAVCEKFLLSPQDCEKTAQLYLGKKKLVEALVWVEKGLTLKKEGGWGNEDSSNLSHLKRDILHRLGRTEEALAVAWSDYQRHPAEYTYEDLMKFVPKTERPVWHEKAMAWAQKADIGSFIGICTKTGEWDALTRRIKETADEALEELSHYVTEPVAQGLQKSHPLMAAKVYRALGLRILKSKKSKYYANALEHFENVKTLYEKNGQENTWSDLVDLIRREHSRKSGFIGDFERLAVGLEPHRAESFEAKARKLWNKPASKNK